MMKPRLKSSPAARDLIKRFEPFRQTAERGDDGRWVVGYGHRAAARGGISVSEEEASLLLIYDVMRAEEAIDETLSIPVSRGQRDALISFVHDIGLNAFKRSDVARYLFEGRLEAAGEALAAHGDGTNPRREAESTMFLDALQPVPAKSQPVELVIKVEHPNEERVLEGAVAGGPPPAPVEDFAPPPPPMPDRRISSRREAEAEIARILATVEAMPLEEREALAAETAVDSIEAALSDRRDDPIEGEYQAVEPEDEPVAEIPQGDADTVEETDTAAIEADVLARVSEAIEADTAPVAAEETVEAVTEDEPAEALAEPVEPLPADTRLGFAFVKNGPLRRRAPVEPAPKPEAKTAPDWVIEPAAQTDIPAAPAEAAARIERPAEYALDLPAGTPLGYAFTAIMAGRFRPQPEREHPQAANRQAVAEAAPDVAPDVAPEAEARPHRSSVQAASLIPAGTAAAVPAVESAPETEPEIEPTADAEAVADEPVAEDDAQTGVVAEIVERAVSVAGDDNPPPHPADHHAEAQGAVGEVAGEARAVSAKPALTGPDHDPLVEDVDPLLDEDFSPQDLASDVPPSREKPLRRADDGIWGFLSIFIAGCVVAGYGLAVTHGDWGWMLSERNLTIDGWATIGGVFLMLASAWPMVSAIVGRLKGNRRKPA
ncbi:lysozyme [Maricaulis parjimensis]|uniref:lysozyme n=1 Tax=Maricaulis parjimensis TaxID=144023 RepID=UPI00193A705C|nr:lysozyme [Maricaulis parjimensis]